MADVRIVSRWGIASSLGRRWGSGSPRGRNAWSTVRKDCWYVAGKKEVSQPLANGGAPSAASVLVDQAAEKMCTQIV